MGGGGAKDFKRFMPIITDHKYCVNMHYVCTRISWVRTELLWLIAVIPLLYQYTTLIIRQ